MFPSLEELAQSFRIADAMDIFVGTALFAVIFQWIRNRSAHALLITAMAMAALYLLSDWLRMYLTLAIFRTGLSLMLFALIVIFQADLRNGFERLTAWNPFRSGQRGEPRAEFVETLVEASAMLAEEKTGALIVLPAREKLDRHLRGGVPLNGQLSIPLLHSIFHPESQGHDGAVVIQGRRIERFSVHLPLSKNFAELGPGGTRHAAALGLSERSDALVIVISEERGEISLAQHGRIQVLGSAAELALKLDEFYRPRSKPPSAWDALKKFTETGLILLMSFFASAGLWLSFAHQIDSVQRVVDRVPIQTQNVPENFIIESIQPEEVRLNIAGSQRAFRAFRWDELSAKVDLSKVEEGHQTLVLGEEAFNLPVEMSVVDIEPSMIRLTAYETQVVQLPIQVETKGELAEGHTLASTTPTPAQVEVRVSLSRLSEVKNIPTEPIDLSGLDSTQTLQANLILPEGVWPAPKSPTSVSVKLEIAETKEKEANE